MGLLQGKCRRLYLFDAFLFEKRDGHFEPVNSDIGDYWLGAKDVWMFHSPVGKTNLANYTITEDRNGLISIKEMIEVDSGLKWKGYIEKGYWRDA